MGRKGAREMRDTKKLVKEIDKDIRYAKLQIEKGHKLDKEKWEERLISFMEIKGIVEKNEQQVLPNEDLVEEIVQVFTPCVYEPLDFDFNKARAEIRKLLQQRQSDDEESVEINCDNEELVKKYTEKIMVWFFKNREMYYRDILYEDAKKIIKKILQRRQPEKVTVTREDRFKILKILRKKMPIRSGNLELIHWFYDNGYQIVKVTEK